MPVTRTTLKLTREEFTDRILNVGPPDDDEPEHSLRGIGPWRAADVYGGRDGYVYVELERPEEPKEED